MPDHYDCEGLAERIGIACRKSTIAKVALATGVTRETTRRYRLGLCEPGAEFLGRLCDHLDLSAEWLLYGRGVQLRCDPGPAGPPLPQPAPEAAPQSEAEERGLTDVEA